MSKSKTVLSTSSVFALLSENGKSLTRAKRDLKRFEIEVSASKVLRKILSDNLRDLNAQIAGRFGKKGHRAKALVAARGFLVAQYNDLMTDLEGYGYTRTQIRQYLEAQGEIVLGLDTLWEEKKAEDAKTSEA